MQTHSRQIGRPQFHVFVVLLVLCASTRTAAGVEHQSFDIPADTLARGLYEFSLQSGLQVLFDSDAVEELTSQAVKGNFDGVEVLPIMLGGTGLGYQFVNDKTVAVTGSNSASRTRALRSHEPRIRTNNGQDKRTAALEITHGGQGAIPEILVKGWLLLNADIQSTGDDIQPYVVFVEEEIEKAGISDVEEFLKNRLPMSATVVTRGRAANRPSNGGIELRGVEPSQTLVLVDGRRALSATDNCVSIEPDVDGIPLSIIERIEISPATAVGNCGPGATGGVVNIVRRRNYSGLDLSARYSDRNTTFWETPDSSRGDV